MVKSSTLIVALFAFAGHNVIAQSSDANPTSELAGLDPGSLSSAIAHAESTLSAMKTDPSYSSILANPTYSSLLNKASSAANPSASSASGDASQSSGSSTRPLGIGALAISAAVAVGLL
ncbi:unnamed protein product [Absidia cylindrospora]